MHSLPGTTGEQESTRINPSAEAATAAAKLLATRSTRDDDMPEIEVGDLVKRHTSAVDMPVLPHLQRVYLVAEIEKRVHSDGRPILGPHGRPTWCKLHDDGDRLTAVKALTLVQKGRQ